MGIACVEVIKGRTKGYVYPKEMASLGGNSWSFGNYYGGVYSIGDCKDVYNLPNSLLCLNDCGGFTKGYVYDRDLVIGSGIIGDNLFKHFVHITTEKARELRDQRKLDELTKGYGGTTKEGEYYYLNMDRVEYKTGTIGKYKEGSTNYLVLEINNLTLYIQRKYCTLVTTPIRFALSLKTKLVVSIDFTADAILVVGVPYTNTRFHEEFIFITDERANKEKKNEAEELGRKEHENLIKRLDSLRPYPMLPSERFSSINIRNPADTWNLIGIDSCGNRISKGDFSTGEIELLYPNVISNYAGLGSYGQGIGRCDRVTAPAEAIISKKVKFKGRTVQRKLDKKVFKMKLIKN